MIAHPPRHRGRLVRRWLWLGALGLLLSPGVIVAYESYSRLSEEAAPPAPALLADFHPYIVRPTGEPADPINLIFRAPDTASVAAAIERVLGWQTIAGGPMDFLDDGRRRPSDRQLGRNLGGGARFHLRIARTDGEEGAGYVLAAVHKDITVACGHIGVEFDHSRDYVAEGFAAAGYRVSGHHLGNTNREAHCDGTRNGGDGTVVIIDLTSR